MFSTMRPDVVASVTAQSGSGEATCLHCLAFIMDAPTPVIARHTKKPTSFFMNEEIKAKMVKVETPARKIFLLPTGISDVGKRSGIPYLEYLLLFLQ